MPSLSDIIKALQFIFTISEKNEKKIAKLTAALEKHANGETTISEKYELEIAFYSVHRRSASAEVILKMANVWPPSRAFRVFSNSWQCLSCDYTEGKLIYFDKLEDRIERIKYKSSIMVLFALGVLAFSVGISLTLNSFYNFLPLFLTGNIIKCTTLIISILAFSQCQPLGA